MKYRSFLYLLSSIALVLSLAVLALPISPAAAASETIELDPEEGNIGDEVEVTGDYFEESYYNSETDYEYFYVTVYFSDEEAEEGDEIDDDVENYEIIDSSDDIDEDGEWDTTFDVPEELTDGDDDVTVSGGSYYVYATYKDDGEIVAVAEFEVIAAAIELDDEEGPVGTEIEITGTDFSAYADITIEFDDEEIDIESGDDSTSSSDFECTIIIPEAVAGEHTITITDDEDYTAEAEFTVEPVITVSPSSSIEAGDSIIVTGTGFGNYADVTIELDGDEVATDETDADGSFKCNFDAPEKSSGSYYIVAEDDDDNTAKATISMLNVAATRTTSPTPSASEPDNFPREGASNSPTGAPGNLPASNPAATQVAPQETATGSGIPVWVPYVGGGILFLLIFLIMIAMRSRAK